MALVKTAPTLTPITKMHHEVDRLFDRFLGDRFMLPDMPAFETAWTPTVDFSETEDAYFVRADVAGMPKENLDVNLEGNVLTLSGRREFRREETREKFIWQEREEGRFVRAIRLPTNVSDDKIDATCHDGVLTVRLPKMEKATKSNIVIK